MGSHGQRRAFQAEGTEGAKDAGRSSYREPDVSGMQSKRGEVGK